MSPKSTRYDAIVVGAGIVGLSCAWRLAQRGLSVLALDREAPGAGASSVAAGMLAPVTEAEFGEEALLRLNLAAAAAWPAFARELEAAAGVTAGYRRSGALVVAADRDDAEELRRLHAFQLSLGLPAEWLPPRECRRVEPGLSPRVAGGILAAGDHQADPRQTTAALAVALERGGGELAAARAEAVEPGKVVLAGGRRLAADTVVVATGAWSASLGLPVRPVKGQLLRLRLAGGGPLAWRIVRTPRCYVLDRGDGRVVVGATSEERGFDTTTTVEGVYRLLEAAYEVLPGVEDLVFEGVVAGLRPGTPDNAPLIGRLGDGLLAATGHYRNGVLLAPVTAGAIAALALGEDPEPELAPFAPDRFAGVPA